MRSIEYLVIAGGGGGGGGENSNGGGGGGGGGGAGGFLTGTIVLSPGVFAITVGGGGSGGASNFYTVRGYAGTNGTNSTFSTLAAFGGGGGAGEEFYNAGNGGSGGGGGGDGALKGTGTVGQGYDGGASAARCGGGGGGAGSVGVIATASGAGAGGLYDPELPPYIPETYVSEYALYLQDTPKHVQGAHWYILSCAHASGGSTIADAVRFSSYFLRPRDLGPIKQTFEEWTTEWTDDQKEECLAEVPEVFKRASEVNDLIYY